MNKYNLTIGFIIIIIIIILYVLTIGFASISPHIVAILVRNCSPKI
jgi:hypothetical protein